MGELDLFALVSLSKQEPGADSPQQGYFPPRGMLVSCVHSSQSRSSQEAELSSRKMPWETTWKK